MSPTRRQARTIAFQFLYGHLPAPDGTATAAVAFDRSEFLGFCESFTLGFDDYSWDVAAGVGQNLPSLDERIAKLSAHWRLDRMPRVDLTILRLASFEILLRPDIPKNVSINEAVELAKAYGEKDSSSFVNGILDRIEKPS